MPDDDKKPLEQRLTANQSPQPAADAIPQPPDTLDELLSQAPVPATPAPAGGAPSCPSGIMTPEEYESIRGEVLGIRASIMENLGRLARILPRLNGFQIKDIKGVLSGFVGRDHIERLRMHGRGIIAEHLAFPIKSLPASILKKLPSTLAGRAALATLNNPNSEVLVRVDGNGKGMIKRVTSLTPMELERLVDARRGILPVADQKFFSDDAYPPLEEASKKDIEESDKFEKFLMIRGSREIIVTGLNNSKIRIPISSLRMVIR